MMLKLQIWSLDLIFAVVIFGFTVTVVGITWLHISNGLSTSYGNVQGILYMQTSSMSDTSCLRRARRQTGRAPSTRPTA